METISKTRKPGFLKMAVTLPLSMPAVLWLSTHKQNLEGTELGKAILVSLQTKSLWDWMNLLLLPLVLLQRAREEGQKLTPKRYP